MSCEDSQLFECHVDGASPEKDLFFVQDNTVNFQFVVVGGMIGLVKIILAEMKNVLSLS